MSQQEKGPISGIPAIPQTNKSLGRPGTSNTGTFPTYRKTAGRNKGIGKYLTQGDEYISAHLAYFLDHELKSKEDRKSFEDQIFRGLKREIKVRIDNKSKKISDKLKKARETGDKVVEKAGKKFDNKREAKNNKEKKKFSDHLDKTKGKSNKTLNLLRKSLSEEPVKLYKKGKEKVMYTPGRPTKGLSQILKQEMNTPLMQKYIISVINSCSIWIRPRDYRTTPIVYPYTIRKGLETLKDEKGKNLKIDKRGFLMESNPINKNFGNKRISGGFLRGEKMRKTDGHGFWANHIQHSTTKAPPLFNFIPNIVWLPKIISVLSDKPEDKFFSGLLKSISHKKYQELHNTKQPILEIIKEVCWEQLNFGSSKKPKTPQGIHLNRIPRINLRPISTKKDIEFILSILEKIANAEKTSINYRDSIINRYLGNLKNRMKGKKSDVFRWLFLYDKAFKMKPNEKIAKTSFKSEKEVRAFLNALCKRDGTSTGMADKLQTKTDHLLFLMKRCNSRASHDTTRKEFIQCVKNELENYENCFIDRRYIDGNIDVVWDKFQKENVVIFKWHTISPNPE